ncbi:GNAT family N-acetyltransferase [Aliikangiella marina]|uniref:GNAT family N-acetyltransferase n=1 Tax=Aliikangiella marina TaxID=1712262 RepID=A0A545T4J4_9GAMM|nr:GNAT family N-acetyltransferase [Aliikangiella marina]TQV72144.1 GNAT family N-acetyltransferase [Aliikangiella marina]
MNIRDIYRNEYLALGQLMADVYANLEDFPSKEEQPEYYQMLLDIGKFSEQENTRVIVAKDDENNLLGGLVYFSDMAHYGSGGEAPKVKNASGIRLLGVGENARGQGVGKALTDYCIQQAKADGNQQVILHTTQAMDIAWKMYEGLGFIRSADLDFRQKDLPVYGFRLAI